MIAIPALDLRDGASVQLVGGDYAKERVRESEPVSTLLRWQRYGFVRTHIVDLDAATGRGTNASLVRELIAGTTMQTQVGGGLRLDTQIAAVFRAGARYAILGTRALEEPLWLERVANTYPEKIIVAADVRGRSVVSNGWQRTLGRDVCDVVAKLNALPLAGVLVTAVHREGQQQGCDLALVEDICARATLPVYAAGGIASMDDLCALADLGVAGAVIGMALHTGALDPSVVAREFAA